MLPPLPIPRPYPSPVDFAETTVGDDPIALFQRWMAEVEAIGHPEPTAMTLATCSAAGRPSARIVLLKGVDSRGFVFLTNYESRKGRELAGIPHAALCFHWHFVGRQVRVEGRVCRLPAEESDALYAARPEGSRIGAWASPQSEVIPDREFLEERVREFDRRHRDRALPRPPHWGGYLVEPEVIEFWCDRPSRLHDRLRFRRLAGQGPWRCERLAP